jgi:hypothetical protein
MSSSWTADSEDQADDSDDFINDAQSGPTTPSLSSGVDCYIQAHAAGAASKLPPRPRWAATLRFADAAQERAFGTYLATALRGQQRALLGVRVVAQVGCWNSCFERRRAGNQ